MATEISIEGLAMLAVNDAARAWWEGHRPVGWSEEQHIKNPCINAGSTDRSKWLAEAVGRMIELERME